MDVNSNANSHQESDMIKIDLMEIIAMLWHYAWMIVISAVVAGVLGFIVSTFFITKTYESNTKIVILNKQNENAITYSDMQLNTQLTKDYAELIKSRYVLESVMETCGVTDESFESFANRVKVVNLPDTRIISITVTDENPQMAQYLAREICIVASERIKSVMDLEAVNVADEANLPKKPADPSVLKWTVVAAMLGALICISVLSVRFVLDDTIKTSEDVEKYLGLSTLALIPNREPETDKKKTKIPDANKKSKETSAGGTK